jgi:hypothetical protein
MKSRADRRQEIGSRASWMSRGWENIDCFISSLDFPLKGRWKLIWDKGDKVQSRSSVRKLTRLERNSRHRGCGFSVRALQELKYLECFLFCLLRFFNMVNLVKKSGKLIDYSMKFTLLRNFELGNLNFDIFLFLK